MQQESSQTDKCSSSCGTVKLRSLMATRYHALTDGVRTLRYTNNRQTEGQRNQDTHAKARTRVSGKLRQSAFVKGTYIIYINLVIYVTYKLYALNVTSPDSQWFDCDHECSEDEGERVN